MIVAMLVCISDVILSLINDSALGGLLMVFQLTEPEHGSRGYQQQLSGVVKNYKAMLSRCLTVGVSLSSVCLHQLFSLPHSWATFMHRFYTVYVKVRGGTDVMFNS